MLLSYNIIVGNMTTTDNYTEMSQSIKVAEDILASDFKYSNSGVLQNTTSNLKNIMMLYPTSSNAETAHELLREQILISSAEADFISDSLADLD